MKTVVLFILFIGSSALHQINQDLDREWLLFKKTYNKAYDNESEDRLRRYIWETNIQYIEHHNLAADRGEHSYWLGLNHIADMSIDEVIEKMTGGMVPRNTSEGSTFLPPNNVQIPSEVDWRKKGYVTPVKNQGSCGSCWAFSATGSLEGQHFRKTGKLVSLSEQNLMDCSSKYGNRGCNGGWVSTSFAYVKNNRGIDTENGYQYEGKVGNCRYTKSNIGATITGHMMIKQGDENQLKEAVATVGPVSACIDVDENFQLYKRGVFNNPSCKPYPTNHCVLVVGYGTQSDDNYWLVKNSWGNSWGIGGYILMSRNRNNQCGIATDAIYPLM
ncbi:procathepsin L-like [Mytilus californianus]|uniref:procathepsin L-like n=1 Tax=Mytilus californianus TaxID=6549 RepID=UPI0022476ABD|nr:procathepsin L-like [Mytilus californianus]